MSMSLTDAPQGPLHPSQAPSGGSACRRPPAEAPGRFGATSLTDTVLKVGAAVAAREERKEQGGPCLLEVCPEAKFLPSRLPSGEA